MEPLYRRYQNERPVGVQALSNTFGIAVFDPLEEDRSDCDYVAAWFTEDDYEGFHRHKVSYTPSGRAYLRKGRFKFYLDEIMRTDI